MLTLRSLIVLQTSFAAASLAYLFTSVIRTKLTGEPLSAAPLLPSVLMFIGYIGCLYLPRIGKIGWYRVSMVVAIVLFGGGGVIGNVMRYLDSGLAQYATFGAWLVAVAINAYGTILNFIAAMGWFTVPHQSHRTEKPSL